MTLHFDSLFQSFVNAGWPVFADAAIKGAVVLSVAWLTTLAMYRASAAMRHLVWTLAVYGTLALPILSGLLPGWRILPAWMARTRIVAVAPIAQSAAPSVSPVIFDQPPAQYPPEQFFGTRELPKVWVNGPRENVVIPPPFTPPVLQILAAPTAIQPTAQTAIPWWKQISWQAWILAAWGCGMAITILPVVVSLLGLWRLGRRSGRMEGGSWRVLLRECSERLGLRHHITLLRGRRLAMPMTWGILSPKLLLPPEADHWLNDRRRVVVMHELAHVRRRDFLTQLLVHFARSIHWFNPLIWLASKRIALESEGACDDLVLCQNTKASDYAEHLLTVAAGLRGGVMLPIAAVTMARSSRLEGRLAAILDANRNRRTLTVAAIVIATILLAGALLPLAMVGAADRDEHIGTRIEIAPSIATLPTTVPSEAGKNNGGGHVDALGSVGRYDRVPPEERKGQGPQPVPIVFSVPEANVAAIVKSFDAHKSMAVDIFDRTMTKKLGRGSLVGINNHIDAETGTLSCKAVVIPVDDALLLPNQFVNVRLTLETATQADAGSAPETDPHRQVLEAQLKQARAEAALQEKQYRAGLIDILQVQAAQNKVDILEAELAGDPVKVAEATLVGVRRVLELSKALHANGTMSALDYEKAKGEVSIAEAKLREAKERAADGGHVNGPVAPADGKAGTAGELAGTVTDESGKPMAGVLVDVWTWCPGDETRTDQQGHYLLKKLGVDPVEIRFSKDGFDPWYNPVQPTGIANLDVRLSNRTYFEGVVKASDGKPLKDALVRAASSPKSNPAVEIGAVWTETHTDQDGHYRLYVTPDKYVIQVHVPKVGAARLPQSEIADGQTPAVDIHLTPGVTFRAIVLDSQSGLPIRNARLSNWQHKGIEGSSDNDGKLTIDGMSPGNFTFTVSATGYARWWSEQAVQPDQKQEHLDGLHRNFDDLEFDVKEDMTPVRIELERAVRISGIVRDPDGKPVAGATVAPAHTGTGNSLTGDTRYSVQSNKDGAFIMTLPASGSAKYNLEAADGRKWANGVLNPIQTKPGDELKDIVIKLTRPAIVRGHVNDETGKPLADRDVRASAADMMENRYYDPTTKTDKNGNFVLKLVRPGDQFIQAAPFFWCNFPSDGMTLKLKEGQTNSLNVALKPGETRDGIELTAPASTAFPTAEEQLHMMIEKSEKEDADHKAARADAGDKHLAPATAPASPLPSPDVKPIAAPATKPAANAEAAQDLWRLKGQWKVASIDGDGSLFRLRQTQVGDPIRIDRVSKRAQTPQGLHDYYAISPLKMPKEFDVTFWAEDLFVTQKGIYQLDGDRLTLCVARVEGARPNRMAAEKDKSTVIVLSRVTPDPNPPKPINVRGHVVDDATGKPISKFSIQGGRVDEDDASKTTWGYFLETRDKNPKGEFSANIDWFNDWRARIIASGYVSTPILMQTPKDDAVEIADVVVRLKRGRQVSGHVFDHAGKPVKDAGVYVVGNPSINLTGGKAMELSGGFVEDRKAVRIATDADGAFTITGVGADAHRIAVTCSAVDLWVVPVPEPGVADDHFDIHLPEPGKLIVHYDISGAPDKSRILMQLNTWDMPTWAGVTSDCYYPVQQHVDFVLDNLPAGQYTIDRSKNNGLKNKRDEALLDRQTFAIESGKTTVVEFVRPKGSPITGQVVGLDAGDVAKAKPTRVYVRVQSPKGNRWEAALFDSVGMEPGDKPMDGKFTTERIPPGKYKVKAEVFIPETEEQSHSTGIVPPAFEGEVLVTVPEQGAPEPVKIQLAPFKFPPPARATE